MLITYLYTIHAQNGINPLCTFNYLVLIIHKKMQKLYFYLRQSASNERTAKEHNNVGFVIDCLSAFHHKKYLQNVNKFNKYFQQSVSLLK